jgi:mRNA interferase HigB
MSEYADSDIFFRACYIECMADNCKCTNELTRQYKNSSIVGEGRVVFNIKGNSYRLVVAIDYVFQVIFIEFIGTHKQYDKIDVKVI